MKDEEPVYTAGGRVTRKKQNKKIVEKSEGDD